MDGSAKQQLRTRLSSAAWQWMLPWVVCGALVVTGLGQLWAGGGDDEVDLEAVIARVVARQEKIESLECRWVTSWVVRKGSMSAVDEETGDEAPGQLPAEDTPRKHEYRLLIEGRKMRVEEKGVAWHVGMKVFLPLHWEAVLVDGKGRYLDRATGFGRTTLPMDIRDIATYYPLLFFCRLFDPVLGRASADEVTLVGRAEHQGRPCIVIEQRTEGRTVGRASQFWLAEDMDYVVVRWERKRDDEELAFRVLDVQYEEDEHVGWRPKSWRLLRENETLKTVVTEMRINPPVAPDAFDIVFPPGTRVRDDLEDRTYVVGEEGEQEKAP